MTTYPYKGKPMQIERIDHVTGELVFFGSKKIFKIPPNSYVLSGSNFVFFGNLHSKDNISVVYEGLNLEILYVVPNAA